jgi:comEA protein
MFQRLFNWLSLTPTERRVLFFLAGTLVAGVAIRYYQDAFPPEWKYDYQAADSVFAAYQARITADTTGAKPGSGIRLLNINTASLADLLTLPGIGRTLAERIVQHRERNGLFAEVDELRRVKGIGGKKFEKLKPYISVQ